MRRLSALLALLLPLANPAMAGECDPVDWLSLPLPAGDPVEVALETAYPGSDLDTAAGVFTTADGIAVPWQPARDVPPAERLDDATIGDMFVHGYPLDYDLAARRTPWQDPGRVRNDAFFRALWFNDEASARAALETATYSGAGQTTRFTMTGKHCVRQQLQAALDEVAGLGAAMDRYFRNVGGTFNWRRIAGTSRLSSHSFGIAVDLNTRLGSYWRWSGAKPGQAGEMDMPYPPELVAAMERYGFIWGGKWHHFDSFHFEYRPDLILHARLTGG